MDARALSVRMLAVVVAAVGVVVLWCGSALAASAPTVSEEAVSVVAFGEANVSASVDPESAATTYHVEYGLEEHSPGQAYEFSTPESAPVGSDAGQHTAVANLKGLSPGTTYYFRFVVTNEIGSNTGAGSHFQTYPTPVFSGGCSNELRREEQNALYLPDCRAYEMVSPLDKNGSDVAGAGTVTMASADGNGVAYAARAGFAETSGSGDFGYTQYAAIRDASGHWVSKGITPTPSPEAYEVFIGATTVVSTAEDMRHAVVEAYTLPNTANSIPKGFNYYSEDIATGGLETVSQNLGEEPAFFFAVEGALRGYSSDMGVVTFETFADLLPGLSDFNEKLYAWDHGTLHVAGVLPDGTLPPGGSVAAVEQGRFNIEENAGTVSADGSKIVFVTPETGQLYVRRDETSTAWVSESEASSPVAKPKNVRFWKMTPDGKKIVFTSGDPLTDSDPGGEGVGIYVYTDGPSPESETNLQFVARIEPNGDAVNAISNDAKRIYFYTQVAPGFTQRGTYLWDEGTVRLAFPSEQSLSQITSFAPQRRLQVSSDARRAVALTSEKLTSDDSSGRIQAYVYDEANETVRCPSCMPTGQASKSQVIVEPEATKTFGTLTLPETPHFISSDGRHAFFTTADPLVATDTNGVPDVYEYDVESGAVSLLSPGTEQHGAWMASDSVSGDDVFILTRDPLVGSDTDTLVDLYDVRVGGGVPQPVPQTGGCVGDECQGVPSAAPNFNTASGFAGLGNVATGSKGAAKPRSLTRAQKLARALKQCKRKPKNARKRCIAQAKRRYGPRQAKKSNRAHKSTSGNARR